jgi:hypothetical protein
MISAGTYAISNYEQYLTNLNGDAASPGDAVEFTNGLGDGQDSSWQLISHGTVSASGNTFTVESGLNGAYDGATIWELKNPGPDLDLGGCPGGDWDHTCLNTPPNNYFLIVYTGTDSDYYMVSVHASNEGYAETREELSPYLLCFSETLYRGIFLGWVGQGGQRPSGSTLTFHQLPDYRHPVRHGPPGTRVR